MKRRRVEILVAAVVLFVIASPLMAALEFNDGGVWVIQYEINGDVWVDYQSPGMRTTVNILEGGGISSGDLQGFEDSIINMSGGLIRGGLEAHHSSQVAVSGGLMHWLNTFDSSQVAISGGSIVARGGRLSTYDRSQVTVSGGSVLWLDAHDSSQVTVSGGAIGGGDTVRAFDNAQVTISGGLLALRLDVSDDAVLTIDGSDFAVDGAPVGYIELTSILGLGYTDEPYRRLTGTLLSGETLDNHFRIGNSARIVLIPEPATLLLLGFGGMALLKKRRQA